jgi:hypothetical protein
MIAPLLLGVFLQVGLVALFSQRDGFPVPTREVRDAIHAIKRLGLPKGGAQRNPDVVVDLNSGEVYVKLPDGSPRNDSIGNIGSPTGASMSGESWARVSLRVVSDRKSVEEIELAMARANESGSDSLYAIDIVDDSAVLLDEQLRTTKNFLEDRLRVLEQLGPEVEMNLSIGWTPREPQDGIVIDMELIGLLHRLGCYVLLDTYVE